MGSELTTHRTARGFVNRPGHWTMGQEYPFFCIHCGTDFDAHKSTWPEMRCPVRRMVDVTPLLEALECAETVLILLQDEVAALGCRADKVLPKVQAAIRGAK